MSSQWCIGRINGEYLARMEHLLHLYSLLYDAQYPVVCIDERPCTLHANVIEPLPLTPGKPLRYDYEYERKGTCVLFVAVEPLTGFRIVEVSRQRKQTDYSRFMQQLAQHYKSAKRIQIVQDNLNTHQSGSFYKTVQPNEAFALARRFDFHYTPKKASWLNMAEIEINAIVRQCLKRRRIESLEMMAHEISQLVKERNKKKIKITWQFTTEHARDKLGRHYDKVLSNN